MKRIVLEIGLAVTVIICGLEAVHYREAVLESNVDRNRAWKMVRELREKCEQPQLHAHPASAR
jgi:hypothetical protein